MMQEKQFSLGSGQLGIRDGASHGKGMRSSSDRLAGCSVGSGIAFQDGGLYWYWLLSPKVGYVFYNQGS